MKGQMNAAWLIGLILIVSSCSDDEDLLSGKRFLYEIFYSKSGTSIYDTHYSSWSWEPPIEYLESYKDNDYAHSRVWEGRWFINNDGVIVSVDKLLPIECYTSVTKSEGQYTCSRNEIITDSIFEIEFTDNKCIINIHAVKCSLNKDQVLSCKQYVYLFNEGRYNIDGYGDYILIDKDKATITTILGQVISSIPLTDFKGEIKGKCNYLDQIEEVSDLNESYEYIVDEDDVRLMNEAGRLCGIFNLKTKKMAFF